jgi:hypothetical protein
VQELIGLNKTGKSNMHVFIMGETSLHFLLETEIFQAYIISQSVEMGHRSHSQQLELICRII